VAERRLDRRLRRDRNYPAVANRGSGLCRRPNLLAQHQLGDNTGWHDRIRVLPAVQSFAGFCLAIGLVLVPVGALAAQPWQGPVFAAAANVLFIPLLAPANQVTYDTQQFYNNTLALFSGMGAVMLALVLLPPLSPAVRARRLLALTLPDLRRFAAGGTSSMADDWEGRAYHRLATLRAG
jgi:uncharacterized membrane protein YccC